MMCNNRHQYTIIAQMRKQLTLLSISSNSLTADSERLSAVTVAPALSASGTCVRGRRTSTQATSSSSSTPDCSARIALQGMPYPGPHPRLRLPSLLTRRQPTGLTRDRPTVRPASAVGPESAEPDRRPGQAAAMPRRRYRGSLSTRLTRWSLQRGPSDLRRA